MRIDYWCVCVGEKYNRDHVITLFEMVKKHHPGNYKMSFNCLTDSESLLSDPDSGVMPWDLKSSKPGWWQKIDLFGLAIGGKNIYLDLDVIINGSLTPLIPYCDHNLSMPKNWAKSGHGGFQSSVMCWSGKARGVVWEFDEAKIGEPANGNYGYYTEDNGVKHWGDQEYLTYHYKPLITEIPPGLICSYKYHCQEGPPREAVVIAFHGNPKPWEVTDAWAVKARQL